MLVTLKVPVLGALDDPGAEARHAREIEIASTRDHPSIQRLIGTREPSAEQLEVGRAALEEILRVEGSATPA